jgi:uncharacterized membrane protein YcaP (DUF421 family)
MQIGGVKVDFIWESIVLILVGMVLLRVSGRKSISQMTIPTTVVMISIGSIIIQPIIETSVWRTISAVALFVIVLITVEYLEMKWDWFEKLLTGQSLVVIKDGQLQHRDLKKARLTVDKLEVRLRQVGIRNIKDVRTATLEPNGTLGYELTPDAQPLTVGEFKKLMHLIPSSTESKSSQGQDSLFEEVRKNEHKRDIPSKLH